MTMCGGVIMKKICGAAGLILLAAVLISCGEIAACPQFMPRECVYTANIGFGGTQYDVNVTVSDEGDVGFLFAAPETLCGIGLNIMRDGTANVTCGGLTIPLNGKAPGGIALLSGVFTLGEDDFTGVEVTENCGVELNIVSFAFENGVAKVWFDRNFVPGRIEAVVGGENFVCVVSEFKKLKTEKDNSDVTNALQ